MDLTPQQLATLPPDVQAHIMAQQQKLQELAEKNRPKISKIKVGEKGGVSVYGLGRFPVTLYAESWEALLADGGKQVLDFIKANAASVTRKQR
jgi:hypothetical protein